MESGSLVSDTPREFDIGSDVCFDTAMTSDPQSDTVAGLVLKAFDSLSPGERRQVLAALIQSGLSRGSASHVVGASLPPLPSLEGSFGPGPRMSAGGPPAVLPVRLPQAHLEELRTWCADHGFSMAVVIRGLVERFLESQRPAS
jgi:hypothetical protein